MLWGQNNKLKCKKITTKKERLRGDCYVYKVYKMSNFRLREGRPLVGTIVTADIIITKAVGS